MTETGTEPGPISAGPEGDSGPDLPLVLGSGLLADAIAREMEASGLAVAEGRPVLVASDGWDTRPYPAVRRLCAGRGVPWLPIRTELGRVVIGPVEIPGGEGCVDCAEFRRRSARRYPRHHDALLELHGARLAERPSTWLTGLAADLVAVLVIEEARSLVTEPQAARTRPAMLNVELDTLQVVSHRFLPDPLCPRCGRLPADDATLARLELEPRPKPRPHEYRVRSMADEQESLISCYVDEECGLIRRVTEDGEAGSIVAAAWMGLRDGGRERGFGRTRSYHTSRSVAVLEALERHGGMRPGGRRTRVYAPYAELRADAIDPRTLGTHAAECYTKPGFPFRPFDEARPYRWVWGYSFARRAPILVPETCVYYRLPRAAGDPPPFVYEISNGCALGSCPEEAILHGLLEVAERDAFLMTWYARLRVPRIDLDSAAGRTIPLIAEAIESETGYRVTVFDTTLEQRIPCVWAMAVDTQGGADRPRGVCAAGSHLVPEGAVENALHELAAILPDVIRRYPGQRERARSMAEDPSLVTAMDHHALLYGHSEGFRRLDFLNEPAEVRRFTDLARPDAFGNACLRDDLLAAVDRYLDCGLDVIAVDQTTPEHRIGGFSCFKVIIPGTLPMTFGHDFRRIDGLARLYEVPYILGHRNDRLLPQDVNPDPHPFP